jgi:predicted nucleic-acid-binding protein
VDGAEYVIGIDTNVLVRFLVDDQPGQNQVARQFLSERTADSPAYVSAIVLAETVWVLNKRLKYPMPVIVEVLQSLLAADGLVIECTEELDVLFSQSGPYGDLPDYLIVWAAQRAGCRRIVTFDKAAAKRIPGMELLA